MRSEQNQLHRLNGHENHHLFGLKSLRINSSNRHLWPNILRHSERNIQHVVAKSIKKGVWAEALKIKSLTYLNFIIFRLGGSQGQVGIELFSNSNYGSRQYLSTLPGSIFEQVRNETLSKCVTAGHHRTHVCRLALNPPCRDGLLPFPS